MEYITVKEAALKWGISERHAQQLCTGGRVAGAAKLGNTWAIPADAVKPDDPRKAREAGRADSGRAEEIPQPAADGRKYVPMPLINTAFAPGECENAAKSIADPDQRSIAMAEYYYFSGNSEKASVLAEPYVTHEDIALRLSACWLYVYSNLALDRIDQARLAMAHVQDVVAEVDEETPADIRALAVCINTCARVLLHLPLQADMPAMKSCVALLPTGLRLFALYVQAHQAYLQGAYGASVGIVETALALEGEQYPIPSVYLHLMATMGYMSLRQPEDARAHMLAAWQLAQPDKLLEPLAEHHGLVGGMLEVVLKKDWPEDFRRIIGITYKFAAGWRKIHNPDTGDAVADNLTTMEFTTAMLAARDWSNKEIASHMGIAENTVKNHIAVALQKLHITQRKELKAYMLR